ncbi:MAG: type II secretion system protein [Verrucomicrobiota bacterium]|nr:type II secretion system protein [Verrucomicrobiota bacterium]
MNLESPSVIRCPAWGFTLVEVMIVVALLGIVLATGLPGIGRMLSKDQLTTAVRDTVEGCKLARDRAILQGKRYQFVVRQSGELFIQEAPEVTVALSEGQSLESMEEKPVAETSSGTLMSGFPRKLGEDVAIQLIDVNFIDHMERPEARVTFYPNGTSDEFTVVYAGKGGQRQVTVDIITGIADEVTQ